MEDSIGALQSNVTVLQSDYKALKEMQDSLLRTQQLLIHRIEKLENSVRGAHFPRQHRLYYKQHGTPKGSAPHTSDSYTPSSRTYFPPTLNVASFHNANISTPTPSSTVNLPYTGPNESPQSIASYLPSTPQLSPAPSIHPPNISSCPRLIYKQESRCLPSSFITTKKLVPPAEVISKSLFPS